MADTYRIPIIARGRIIEPGEENFAPDDEMSVQEDSGSREILIGEEVNETGQASTAEKIFSVSSRRVPLAATTCIRI